VRPDRSNRAVGGFKSEAIVTPPDELRDVVLGELPVDVVLNELEGVVDDTGERRRRVAMGVDLRRRPSLSRVLNDVARADHLGAEPTYELDRARIDPPNARQQPLGRVFHGDPRPVAHELAQLVDHLLAARPRAHLG
jgi:hypothetical protein